MSIIKYFKRAVNCHCHITKSPRRNEKHPQIHPSLLLGCVYCTRLVVGPKGPKREKRNWGKDKEQISPRPQLFTNTKFTEDSI